MDTPAGFTVESFTHRSATLVWTDVVDALFYRVYFGLTAQFEEATFYGTILQGAGRAVVAGLFPETAYNFWIVAEGEDGTMSDPALASCTTSASPGKDFEIEAVVEKAVYDWAVNEFGDYAVIWERQNGTKPGKPFVTLGIKSGPPYGGDDHIRSGSRLCGNRILMVDVNIYSDTNPMQMAMDMRTSLQRPDVIDFFTGANIGIGEINGVTDVSQLLDNSNWEQRAHFDFGVLVASDKDFDAGQISEVEYENQIGGN